MVLHTPPPAHADWCSFFAGLYLWTATISNEKKSICMGAWLIVTSTLLGLVINALFNLPILSSSKNHFSGSDEWSFFHQLLQKSCITARKNNSMTFLKLCKIVANFVFKRITRIETTYVSSQQMWGFFVLKPQIFWRQKVPLPQRFLLFFYIDLVDVTLKFLLLLLNYKASMS